MKETWRWYGPLDTIQLPEIVQTGARGIVTALHEIPYGEVWPVEAIAARRAEITAAGSVPGHSRNAAGDHRCDGEPAWNGAGLQQSFLRLTP